MSEARPAEVVAGVGACRCPSCAEKVAAVESRDAEVLAASFRRRRLPSRRGSATHKLEIVDTDTGVRHKVFVGVGFFDDGSVAEVWLDTAKDGTTLRGLFGDFARLVSIALQHGFTVAEFSHSFRGIEYPPRGRVEGHDSIAEATSPLDLLVQVLEAEDAARAARSSS